MKLSAVASKISFQRVYQWLGTDPEFEAQYKKALQHATGILESEAQRRAVYGVAQPVWHKDKQIGSVQKYSDVLLIFLLKAASPEKYRDRYEFHGKVETNQPAIVGLISETFTSLEIERMMERMQEKASSEQGYTNGKGS